MTEDCPEGWEFVRLGQITSKVGSGSTPRGGSESYHQTGIPLIRSMNVRFEGFMREGLAFLNQKQADALKEVAVCSDDVLLNITGASIGRVTQAPVLMDGARVNQHVCIIRPFPEIDAAYLSRYLASPSVQQMIWGKQYGVTRQALTKSQILDFQIPLAPLNEQRRIVERIGTLVEQVNSAHRHLSRVVAIIKRFRQAVLAAAFSGKLTEDWRRLHAAEDPVASLRRSIATKRARAWDSDQSAKHRKRRYPEPFPLDEVELPEIPETWTWVSADEVCAQITDGEHIQPRYQSAGLPMITATHVRDGFVEFKDVGVISEEDFQRCRGRCAPAKDDILIVSVGATTGRAAIVPECEPFAMVRSVLMLRPLMEAKFLLRWIQSRWCQTWISQASGASAQPHFYIHDNKRMPLPLPPSSEQSQIVRRVDAFFALADSIEGHVADATFRTDKVTQSILAKAFRGELVPTEAELARREGREYEAASVLLERIKDQRQNDILSKSNVKSKDLKTKLARAKG